MSNEEMSTPSEPSTPPNARPSWERELLERLLLASVKERQAARRWQWFRGFFWLSALALVLLLPYRPRLALALAGLSLLASPVAAWAQG